MIQTSSDTQLCTSGSRSSGNLHGLNMSERMSATSTARAMLMTSDCNTTTSNSNTRLGPHRPISMLMAMFMFTLKLKLLSMFMFTSLSLVKLKRMCTLILILLLSSPTIIDVHGSSNANSNSNSNSNKHGIFKHKLNKSNIIMSISLNMNKSIYTRKNTGTGTSISTDFASCAFQIHSSSMPMRGGVQSNSNSNSNSNSKLVPATATTSVSSPLASSLSTSKMLLFSSLSYETSTNINLFSNLWTTRNQLHNKPRDVLVQHKPLQFYNSIQSTLVPSQSVLSITTLSPTIQLRSTATSSSSTSTATSISTSIKYRLGLVLKDLFAIAVIPWKIIMQFQTNAFMSMMFQKQTHSMSLSTTNVNVDTAINADDIETIQKLVLLFRDIVDTDINTDSDGNVIANNVGIASSTAAAAAGVTTTNTRVPQPLMKVTSTRRFRQPNNSTNNRNKINYNSTDGNKSRHGRAATSTNKDVDRILAQYDDDDDDDNLVRRKGDDDDDDYKLLVTPSDSIISDAETPMSSTDNENVDSTTYKQQVARKAIELVQEQARKNVLKREQKKIEKKRMIAKDINDDSGQWFIDEQIAEQKERKRLVQQAKKQFILQEKTKRDGVTKRTGTRKTTTGSTKTKAQAMTKQQKQKQHRSLLTPEENTVAEIARIEQSKITNLISNTASSSNIGINNININTMSTIDDPDLKLELLANAAREAVDAYESKNRRLVQQQKQSSNDAVTPITMSKSSSTIMTPTRRNNNDKDKEDTMPFFFDQKIINFDIAQAARDAVQAFETTSKNVFGITSTATKPTTALFDWSKYKVAQLKDELRKRALPITGNKSKLIQMLQDYDQQQQDMISQSNQQDGKQSDNEIILQKDNTIEEEEDDDLSFSWQTDLGLSDSLVANLDKLVQDSQKSIDSYLVQSKQKKQLKDTSDNKTTRNIKHPLTSRTKGTTTLNVPVVPDYETMTVAVLKTELRNRKLVLSGRKAELIARLVANDAEQVQTTPIVQQDNKEQQPLTGIIPNLNDKKERALVSNDNDLILNSFSSSHDDDDDDDDDYIEDVSDEDIQALALIDQLLAGIDDTDEPSDEALRAIENELNAVAATTNLVGASDIGFDDIDTDEKYFLSNQSFDTNNGLIHPQVKQGTVMVDYNNMAVTQLKTELQRRNLRITGKKSDLIERLQSSDELSQSMLYLPIESTSNPFR